MTDVDKLERLNALREKGALSEQEYEQQKARLLSPHAQSQSRYWLIAIAVAVVLLVGLALMFKPSEQKAEPIPAATAPLPLLPSSAPIVEPAPLPVPPNKNVDPPVPKTVAPDPTNADYYNDAKRSMMRANRSQPAGIREMLGDWAGANTLCRGSSEAATIDKWCPIRDALTGKLEKMGMCYGRPTDRSAAESDWHTCDERDRQ